jgi:catechol 2,3-dioxygenase-like lactoylglutathione lyase family enzyme
LLHELLHRSQRAEPHLPVCRYKQQESGWLRVPDHGKEFDVPRPSVRLNFFKLNTPDMERALEFYRAAFGFAVARSFDEADFLEHIMELPGQEGGPSLLLVSYKDGRDVTPGPGHGPVGFLTAEIEALFAQILAAGGEALVPVSALGPVKFAMLRDPDGHELELVQLPDG